MLEAVGRQVCPACLREHPETLFRCSACGREFWCRSQFVTTMTEGGREMTGHVVRRTETYLGDSCGPIAARRAVSRVA